MVIAGIPDLEEEILREHSKRQVTAVARWIGRDKRRFRQLMTLFLRGESRTVECSAWVVSECAQRSPELVHQWLPPMLAKMQEPGVHVAVPRNVLRVFEVVEIPKQLQGEVVTLCFEYLMNPSAPIAIHAYSMSILLKISRLEPELRNEIRAVIERLLPVGSAGVLARGRKVLKELSRLEKAGG